MKSEHVQFTGDIPRHYDEGLGPHIFIDYARDLAERVAALQPGRVLELAAGTGIVTRCLRDALPASVPLTATDLNPDMLEIAGARIAGTETVELRPADAIELPFEDESFDAVACQFGVMFFPDKDRGYREAHRVLTPGGSYAFSVWGPLEENLFARVAVDSLDDLFASDPPQFYRLPFSYHEHAPIRASLEAAGFEAIALTDVPISKQVDDVGLFARGLVYGNPSAEELRARGVDPDNAVAVVADALRAAMGDEPYRMSLLATVVTARKPA